MQIFDEIDTAKVVVLLRDGGVGIIPTDTVYGLVCSAKDRAAVERLFSVKKRAAKPGTVLAANVEQLIDLGIRARYVRAVERYWPNAISVVVPCDETLAYLHAGKQSLAVRVPADENIRQLLEKVGPLMTTSANHPGNPVATNVAQAQQLFGDAVDFYVDGGERAAQAPSTIIRIIDDAIEVVRAGAVDMDETGRVSHG